MTSAILLAFALLIIGMLLIAVEVFVVPGFGVTGIAGGIIVIGATIYAWTETDALWGTAIALFALITSFGFVVLVPKTKMGKRLTLNNQISEKSNYHAEAIRAGVTVGQRGVTITELKPSGFALMNSERIEVRSGGEWIDRDVQVVVVEFKSGRVIVETCED